MKMSFLLPLNLISMRVMYMSWTCNSDGLMTIGKCGLTGDLLLLLLLLLLLPVVLEAVCGCRRLNI